MNHRITTLAAIAIIGTTTLGLESLAVSGAARRATDLLGSPEARAVGRAGRIAAESIGNIAADHARTIALDATLGVVRGLGAVYAATAGRPLSSAVPHRQIRIIRMLENRNADFDFNFDADLKGLEIPMDVDPGNVEIPCCEREKDGNITS